MTDELPGLSILANAFKALGDATNDLSKVPVLGYSEAEDIRRERLHVAAVARRKKRKRGGPK